VNKFHHNKLRVIATTCGDGDDGIQGIGDGVSVYNNIFIQYIGTILEINMEMVFNLLRARGLSSITIIFRIGETIPFSLMLTGEM
jgi:hypothetical protein